MNDQLYLTEEGRQKLITELKDLKGPKRDAIAKRLKHAIEMGDLSENADYKSAKEDQAFLEGRILEIETILKLAEVVVSKGENSTEVQIGSRVKVQEEGYPPEIYQLVGLKEADPRQLKISYESPIGKSLIGKKKGDVVVITTPSGEITLKILNVDNSI